jgi:hypothetical protein
MPLRERPRKSPDAISNAADIGKTDRDVGGFVIGSILLVGVGATPRPMGANLQCKSGGRDSRC